MASNPVRKLTEEEYLALERAAEFKSEFVNGEMFAMAGGTVAHWLLQANLLGELVPVLRGTPCRAGGSDLKVHVSATGTYAYPDVSIVCGPPVLLDNHRDVILNPSVIIEVLSPSTQGYDRGLKFQHYRTIETLQEYILVEQERMRIEQYIRQPDNTWKFCDYQRPDEELAISSAGVFIPLSRIYDRVEFTSPLGEFI